MTQPPSNEILAAIAAAYTAAFATADASTPAPAPSPSHWAIAARTFSDVEPRTMSGSRWAAAGRRHD